MSGYAQKRAPMELIKDLKDSERCVPAVKEILSRKSEWSVFVPKLNSLLSIKGEDEQSTRQKTYAAYLLGEIKDPSSIKPMIDLLIPTRKKEVRA